MNPATDNDAADQQAEASASTRPRADRSQLLTKIYYPDSLYPDKYTFFTDRSAAIDSSEHNADNSIPTPAATEIERQPSYLVSGRFLLLLALVSISFDRVGPAVAEGNHRPIPRRKPTNNATQRKNLITYLHADDAYRFEVFFVRICTTRDQAE